VRRFLLIALLAAAGPCLAAAPAQDGVVDLELAPSPSPSPGPSPAQGLLEKARRLENLEESAAAYRAAIAAEPAGPAGRQAALELGKQEYALGRPESALALLAGLPEEAFEGEPKAQLLYWRAQSRLVLKGLQKAQDDFESFVKSFPEHPLADSARLAVADCDAGLKNDEAALKGYQELSVPPSSVAPRALHQAALLQARSGKAEEARALWQKLAQAYPDSMEAARAREQLKALPPPLPAPTAQPSPAAAQAYSIQVGAFSNRTAALKLFKTLKKRRYPVRLEKRVLKDKLYHLVQVGRYKSEALAKKAALRIQAREKLPTRVVAAP
jgi:TolA-binding protein